MNCRPLARVISEETYLMTCLKPSLSPDSDTGVSSALEFGSRMSILAPVVCSNPQMVRPWYLPNHVKVMIDR